MPTTAWLTYGQQCRPGGTLKEGGGRRESAGGTEATLGVAERKHSEVDAVV